MKGYGYTIIITVKNVKGKCAVGHKAGDKIIFDGFRVKGKICSSALAAMMSTVHAFAWGVRFPWDKKENITHFSCPDPVNCVTFELKRDIKNPWYKKKQDSICLSK